MVNVHICNDEKFIPKAIQDFEKFYPKQNFFYIITSKKPKFVSLEKNVKCFKKQELQNIVEDILLHTANSSEINILVHFLDPFKAILISSLGNKLKFKSYWIFYGSDLYKRLYDIGKYDLYDNDYFFIKSIVKRVRFQLLASRSSKRIEEFINNLDYLCFWNRFDYEILIKNYNTEAKYKNFIYTHGLLEATSFPLRPKKSIDKILINHSGSETGNHISILSFLKKIKISEKISELIVPLNYGPIENIEIIDRYCKENFSEIYKPVLNFIDRDEYFKMLQNVDIAIFGHNRQEAAGNLNFLLTAGVKVFLKEKNNLLQFYHEIGVKVYSFENDFKNDFKNDFTPLNLKTQEKNRTTLLNYYSEKNLNKIYLNLFNN